MPGVGWQGGGGEAGALAVVKAPVGNTGVQALRKFAAQLQMVLGIGNKDPGQAAKGARHRRLTQLKNLHGLQRGREVASQLEQGVRAAFPAGRHAGSEAQVGRELTNQHAHAQHDGKGHQILHIGHRK